MIELQGVGKVYPGSDIPAVADLDLSIPKGEILVLVGPSGCGKSTTLRLINRMIEPTSGRIIFDGEDVTTRSTPTSCVARSATSSSRSVCSRTRRSPRTSPPCRNCSDGTRLETAARVDELLEITGLDPNQYRDRYPKELSGGQAQRVGVARRSAVTPTCC